jgi:hypothetical protein
MLEASESGGRLPLQADAAEGEQEAGHVGPLVDLVLQLVLRAKKQEKGKRSTKTNILCSNAAMYVDHFVYQHFIYLGRYQQFVFQRFIYFIY